MNDAQHLSELLNVSSQIVVFTGAGISTESGIPDYRSKGGLWERFQPVTYQEFLNDINKRREYWLRKKELMEKLISAEPNLGHAAIATMEKHCKKLCGVITQNIDGLHQIAGNSNDKVLELHGTNRFVICLNCHDRQPFHKIYERLKQGEDIPRCLSCDGILKPDTISFGQSLDPSVLFKAGEWVKRCDLLLAVGSTLIVEPAASLPLVAKENGAKLAIINLSPTPLDSIADLLIRTPAGQVLHTAVEMTKSNQHLAEVMETDRREV